MERQRACCADSSTSLISCPLTLDSRALCLLHHQHHREGFILSLINRVGRVTERSTRCSELVNYMYSIYSAVLWISYSYSVKRKRTSCSLWPSFKRNMKTQIDFECMMSLKQPSSHRCAWASTTNVDTPTKILQQTLFRWKTKIHLPLRHLTGSHWPAKMS